MAMPRPSGKAQRIAEKVVPGLRRNKQSNSHKNENDSFISEVESKQTRNIDNKIGLRKNEKTKI